MADQRGSLCLTISWYIQPFYVTRPGLYCKHPHDIQWWKIFGWRQDLIYLMNNKPWESSCYHQIPPWENFHWHMPASVWRTAKNFLRIILNCIWFLRRDTTGIFITVIKYLRHCRKSVSTCNNWKNYNMQLFRVGHWHQWTQINKHGCCDWTNNWSLWLAANRFHIKR